MTMHSAGTTASTATDARATARRARVSTRSSLARPGGQLVPIRRRPSGCPRSTCRDAEFRRRRLSATYAGLTVVGVAAIPQPPTCGSRSVSLRRPAIRVAILSGVDGLAGLLDLVEGRIDPQAAASAREFANVNEPELSVSTIVAVLEGDRHIDPGIALQSTSCQIRSWRQLARST